MYSSIAKNKRNTVVIFTAFVAIISAIGFFFSYLYDSPSIFFWCFFGALLYAGVEYALASKIALAMNGAVEVKRAQAPEFYAAVEAISMTAGLPMPKIYVIEDSAPNAFAVGTSPQNSVVCATTGLLAIMNKAELEGVVAHEISHIKNYDIRVSMAAVALTAAIGFLADIAWRILFWRDDDDRDFNPVAMIIGLILVVISPILSMIIRMAISREREYLADASAVMLTRYPEGLISALQKLQDNAQPLRRQASTTANLFITNPLKANFLNQLFATHPPLEKRIQRLKENSEKF
ncbi:MAG: M48 family metalloprotease [bacterium]|nr:M48 family metalloprotease [bacterium]